MNTILRKNYFDLPVSKKEVLRYSGCKNATDEINELLDSACKEAEGTVAFRVCYAEFPLKIEGSNCDFSFAKVNSSDLAKNLQGCKSAVIFAATIGLGFDRLIAKYSKVSASKALIFQALGAERIEALCDEFCNDLALEKKEQGLCLKPRFSPGYGDLPLEFQKDIFRVLDCPRQIGLTLGDNLLMSPTKSVTAIVGISDR